MVTRDLGSRKAARASDEFGRRYLKGSALTAPPKSGGIAQHTASLWQLALPIASVISVWAGPPRLFSRRDQLETPSPAAPVPISQQVPLHRRSPVGAHSPAAGKPCLFAE